MHMMRVSLLARGPPAHLPGERDLDVHVEHVVKLEVGHVVRALQQGGVGEKLHALVGRLGDPMCLVHAWEAFVG